MGVALIALVDVDAAHFDASQRLQVFDHRPERVAIERVAVQGLGMQHELAALGPGDRGGDRDLAAELVRGAGLALGDAR